MIKIFKSSPQEVYLRKGVLKICSKFTGKHPMSNFIEIALRHGYSPVNLLHIFRTPFSWNTSGWLLLNLWNNCVKSVQIRSFFWFVFFPIRTEHGEIQSISPYSVQIRENTDQKKLRSATLFTQCMKKFRDLRMEHLYSHILIGLALIQNSCFIEDVSVVAASKWLITYLFFNLMMKEKCQMHHSHKKQIVWKLGPNGPFCALMLRTKLY